MLNAPKQKLSSNTYRHVCFQSDETQTIFVQVIALSILSACCKTHFVQSCRICSIQQGRSPVLQRGTQELTLGVEEGETLKQPASAMLLPLLLLLPL